MVGIHVSNTVTYLQGAAGAGHEHDPALLALLYLPILVFTFMLAVEMGHQGGVAVASRMRSGYQRLAAPAQFALLLIAVAAAIHLALIPVHWAEDRSRAILFIADSFALLAVAVGAFVSSRWATPARLLLAANVLAYAFYVLTGREGLDAIGIFTQVVEFSALVLVLVGHRAEQPSTIPGSRPGITHPEVNPQ